MKTLVLSLTVLASLGLAGVAQAGPGCSGSYHEQTAETPPRAARPAGRSGAPSGRMKK